MSGESHPGALILGSDFQALGAARSLAAHHVPLFLLETETGIARYSRHVRRRAMVRNLFHREAGVDFLLDLVEREGLQGWVPYATSDDGVRFLAEHRDQLSAALRVPVPPWEVTQKFYFKEQAYRLAAAHDIPIPRMYEAENLDALLAQDISFPAVLKPSCKEGYYERTKKKGIRVDSRDELVREYQRMNAIIPADRIVVQQFLNGGPGNLYSYATVFDGQQPVVGMAARRARQHPMDFGHATTFAESVDPAEMRELSTRLLRAMNYRGVAEVEFMYDPDTQCYRFLEINGRLWGWHTLAKAAGVNVPYALFQLMTAGAVASARPNPGVKWIRLITDTPTAVLEMLRGRMSPRSYLRSFVGTTEFAVFSWRDPLPFFVEFALVPYLWWKKGF